MDTIVVTKAVVIVAAASVGVWGAAGHLATSNFMISL